MIKVDHITLGWWDSDCHAVYYGECGHGGLDGLRVTNTLVIVADELVGC